MKCSPTCGECPALYEEEPDGEWIAIGKKLAEGATTRFPVGEDEVACRIPREVMLAAFGTILKNEVAP